jgi:hypothetical protein
MARGLLQLYLYNHPEKDRNVARVVDVSIETIKMDDEKQKKYSMRRNIKILYGITWKVNQKKLFMV